MAMDKRQEVLARVAAKKFATRLRQERWAEPIPAEWEKLTDEQIRYAITLLPSLGLQRRESDWKWEPAW